MAKTKITEILRLRPQNHIFQNQHKNQHMNSANLEQPTLSAILMSMIFASKFWLQRCANSYFFADVDETTLIR